MSEIKTIIFNIGDGSSENLREQYNTNFVGDYSELIEQIRQSDEETVVKFIKYNDNEEEEILISAKIDCGVPNGQFRLEGFKDKGGNFYVLNEYNYFHKDLQLLPLAEAVSFLSNRINNLDKPKQVARLENSSEDKIKEEMMAIKKATDGGNGIIYTSGHEEVSRFVNSIIFSLCESARMAPCYDIAKIMINDQQGDKNYSIEGLKGYVNCYSDCYEFIHDKELRGIKNIGERKVLIEEDFEIFSEYRNLQEKFRLDEHKTEDFNKLIQDYKLLSIKEMNGLNFQEKERLRGIDFEKIQNIFNMKCKENEYPFSSIELSAIFTLCKKIVGNKNIELNKKDRQYNFVGM